MATNSITPVSSSVSAALQIQPPRTERPAPGTEASLAAEESSRARQAQGPREPEPPPVAETRAAEAPRPVLNTDGQTTGRLISTTA